MNYKRITNITGWIVFAIAFIVYFMSAERTGSLWDCGEFILGAYKLQVVHPPGAPLFLLIGRMFAWLAEIFSSNPEHIAFAVNMLSGVCTAFAAMFVTWITMIFGNIALRKANTSDATNAENDNYTWTASSGDLYALAGAGLVAGLSTAFATSIWFSAVEGEVYAMSTMFTALTIWCAAKWYSLPDVPKSDKWIVLSVYAAGLSIGVHLLSILTFPAIALLYYLKKYKNHKITGAILSMIAGVAMIVFIQKVIIVGIPTIWKHLDKFFVNNLGLPVHSGIIPTAIIVGLVLFALLRYTHKHGKYTMQLLTVCALLLVVSFSTMGVVVIRANADTPVNMNVPSDAFRLLPYLNREQYGERPLLFGPHYNAKPEKVEYSDRYGLVNGKYEIVEQKLDVQYKQKDKMLFPRVSHTDPGRPAEYAEWGGKEKGKPSMGFNMKYLFQYQMGWMYWRYFGWNFIGRQNGKQGYKPWDKSSGHSVSGISFLDEMKLEYDTDLLPDSFANDKANNTYYYLPFLFGLFGLFFHLRHSQKEFFALLVLFIITGIGIIIYSNQPPREPRERDYVLAGSIFTYCIWIGMGVLAIYSMLKKRMNMSGMTPALIGGALALSAPLIMGFQNFDDHTRKDHSGARDYASNFLESCEPNSIIFTYGDNDTYPLWYAQEVENIRTDVRVVNLSLIAVDWYIDKLRRKVNDSPPLNLTIPSEAYRGDKRNQVFFYNPQGNIEDPVDLQNELKFIANPKNNIEGQTIMRSVNLIIPTNMQKAYEIGLLDRSDTTNVAQGIQIRLPKSPAYITKDELAILDVVSSNIWDRPIYFATTCRNDKLLGMNDYMQLEGLGLRVLPVKTPSDKALSIYGSGRVDVDKLYDNVMNKWKWGNFDKVDTYISSSFGAAAQSMRMIMMRGAEELIKRGDKTRAANLAKKYFEGFPHFNFTYSPTTMPFISVLIAADEKEEAKKHLNILVDEMSQQLDFFSSLDEEILKSSFEFEYLYNMRAVEEILLASSMLGDPEFEKKAKSLLSRYDVSSMRN